MTQLNHLIPTLVFAPLVACLIAGLFRNQIGRAWSHRVTIIGVAISFALSVLVAKEILFDGVTPYTHTLYTWASGGDLFKFNFTIGFLIDQLTAVMLIVVTFVSLCVHVYTIGYMADDEGYQRFFSYISLFTFAMLMLVTANNFLQLFFGWEGVGLVSYLLIGFWFKREAAIAGSLKAFLVNRVGDFGFIMGIAMILAYTGSVDYSVVFSHAPKLASQTISLFPNTPWSVDTVICLLLFLGAMGKSAQMPLHVWLPASMEGPTPISALIHAATMVTAGVFMVSRMSPLFELSQVALSTVLVIGATSALFMGLLAVVMNDIKRVIAYSTLSQLGYMIAALGASAYAAGIFHLATHAAFKAVLFLAAGSVIMAMHHEQDMRKMGGLRKYMPITYITFLIGSLALCAIPPFAGFFSKDMIIDAIGQATIPGARYAYYCVAIGAFVTGLYTFRALFLTFHTKPRMDEQTREHLKESSWVVWAPLVALAIPSVILGGIFIKPMLFDKPSFLGRSIFVLPEHGVLAKLGEEFHGVWSMMFHSVQTPTFWLAVSGIIVAWVCYILVPTIPERLASSFSGLHRMLLNKYGFDDFNDKVFVRGARKVGDILFGLGDRRLIDGLGVNGSGLTVRWMALHARLMQTGYLYHYATAMVLGVLVLLSWLIFF